MTTPVVLDASAGVEITFGTARGRALSRLLPAGATLWAPEHYFAETASINASNDVAFSTALLSSYAVSLLAALALAWFLSRRPHLVFLLPIIALVFAVVEVLRLRPESPIALFPTIAPWRPALISIAAAATAALFIYAPRLNTNDRNA